MDEILTAIDDRSPRGIAGALSRLISSGTLAPGDRLPTVRELARGLGVSPATVSEAWQALAGVGAIESRGRLGTYVLGGRPSTGPVRYRLMSDAGDNFRIDLSTGTPDPDLLPDLGPALARVGRRARTERYFDDPVIAPLHELLVATWPFPAEHITVVDGALDALDRVAGELVRLGDRVLVEDPCFPPIVDLLERLGAEVRGLPLDEEGIVPEALALALEHNPVALFLQPRAQNPTGTSMTPTRARRLARILRPTPTVIVEDDHSGDISTAPDVSLGSALPSRTVHIRSYSKSHGPELRIAAVGGAGEIVERLAARRTLGPGWTSRILQAVLVELLQDQVAVDAVSEAREVYAGRRGDLRAALATHGVPSTPGDGVNLWVDVGDERTALVHLAAQGIRVAPGSPFTIGATMGDHVRVTAGNVRDGAGQLAAQLAAAARPTPGGRRV